MVGSTRDCILEGPVTYCCEWSRWLTWTLASLVGMVSSVLGNTVTAKGGSFSSLLLLLETQRSVALISEQAEPACCTATKSVRSEIQHTVNPFPCSQCCRASETVLQRDMSVWSHCGSVVIGHISLPHSQIPGNK